MRFGCQGYGYVDCAVVGGALLCVLDKVVEHAGYEVGVGHDEDVGVGAGVG